MIRHARAEEERVSVVHLVGDFWSVGLAEVRTRLATKKGFRASENSEQRDPGGVNKHIAGEPAFVAAARRDGVDRDDACTFLLETDDAVFEEHRGGRFGLQQG